MPAVYVKTVAGEEAQWTSETKKAAQGRYFRGFQALCCALVEANMAQRTGLEPATPGVTGRYSNRLNYRCA